jgi:hypothetical protein
MCGRDAGPTFGARRWKLAKLSYGVDSRLGPDPILRATVDFSERWPEIWPNVSRKFYRVHELGDCWAEVTEGSTGGTWARERYEWPNPGMVRATVQDSNIFQPGGIWELRARPKEGGGTRIDVLYHRQARGLKGHLGGALMQLLGRKLASWSLAQTMAKIEHDELGDSIP